MFENHRQLIANSHARLVAKCGSGKDRYRCLRHCGFMTILFASIAVPNAQAQLGQFEHQHVPVVIDSKLSWDDIISASVDSHPRRFELLAQQQEASAWRSRSTNLLAAAPSVYFSYLSDSSLDKLALREYQSGLELPLWRAGQRRATRDLATAATGHTDAAATALRWEVAGALRNVLWDIAVSENQLAWAQDSLTVAEELVRVVERRSELGDLPEADVLLARNARLGQEMAVVEAEALLLDAERVYRSLTGLDRRPALLDEPLTAEQELRQSHPLLMLAATEVDNARANFAFVERASRGAPAVTIGPRRQRDPLSTFYVDSLAIAVKMPIGGKNHGATDRASAGRLLGEAETQRAQLLRQLELELHEAEHTLFVLTESLLLAERQADLAARQWEMAQSAFDYGEIELRDLLRIQDTAQAAATEVGRLRFERHRAVAAVNQAVGEIP